MIDEAFRKHTHCGSSFSVFLTEKLDPPPPLGCFILSFCIYVSFDFLLLYFVFYSILFLHTSHSLRHSFILCLFIGSC